MRSLFFGLLAAGILHAEPLLTYQLPADQYRRAVEFHRWVDFLHFGGAGWDFAVLGIMVWFRLGPRVWAWTGSRLAATAVLLGIPWAADLPLAVARHFVGLHYGLSVQGWGSWLMDLLKASGIGGVLAVILFPLALWVYGRWRRGWIAVWAGCVVFIVAATWAVPVFFDPLFYKFRPLETVDSPLVGALQAVSNRAGYHIPASHMFVMDASRNTRAVNAYMTGVGGSRRIVIWDTTLGVLNVPQIQTVFAHEVGHYALHHIPLGISAAAAGLLLTFWILRAIARRMPYRDVALIPVILLVTAALGFFSEPLSNGLSRWIEHQADIYELEAMHALVPNEGRNSAEVDQILSAIDLDNPEPGAFIKFWRYDHPPVDERMRFAQTYDPWQPGRSPRYIR